MPDLRSESLMAGLQAPVNDKAAAMPGADDDAEYHARIFPRAVNSFRNRKAIRVVGKANGTAQRRLDIASQRPAIEQRRVCITYDASLWRGAAGHADADTSLLPGFLFCKFHEPDDRADAILIAAFRCFYALARTFPAITIQRNDLHFRAAPVYSYEHVDLFIEFGCRFPG